MPITINFDAVPTGLNQTYVEQGFTFSTQLFPLDAFWNRSQTSDLGTGGYLINQYSSDTVIVKPNTGGAFGATSIQIDGFNFGGFNGTTPITGTSQVDFYFQGVKTDGNIVTFQAPTTDAVAGFQTIALPAEFASGLKELRWFVVGGTGWGAFDNLTLTLNSAPVAQNFNASTQGGTLYTGHLSATDADNQPLLYQAVGPLPAGVVLDSDGTFYVQPVAGDADLNSARHVTFQYRAFDGTDYSAAQTVKITLTPVPNGPDKLGTSRGDTLSGTAGADRMWGKDGNDKLAAAGGSDKLYGGDGKDTISAGDGQDQVWGEDGDDSLDAGAGNDFVYGADGRDTLVGGSGDDTLTGGSDNDQFVFGNGFGDDVILDFNSGHWEKDGHYDKWRRNDRDGGDCRYWRDDDRDDHHWDRYGYRWEWEAGDTIKVSPSVFGSFEDLMESARQTWYGVVITADDGSSLTLVGVSLKSLNAEDFIFG